ncbi:SMP-30/gluconolactonase/LRE family protein [Martelella soudanensis]|uniref:SMP-30/gluconolactonase/LRE family protein n=1 Tax=unclassified Martelella TaxID=2629616 RepID=UPI0015DE05A9|nr:MULTISPECIES: SMP-30/gluconolactonase/LRE family protein [unclassified Martelella]
MSAGNPAMAQASMRVAQLAEPQVTVIDASSTRLGECPLWDADGQRLYYIDSLSRHIISLRQDGTDRQLWTLPVIVGSIGLAGPGRFIAGLENGFAFIDISGPDAVIEPICDPEADMAETRLNDGKVDPMGRYWCGSMSVDLSRPVGSLYRLDYDLTWTRVETGITVSNGIAFSPDTTRLYFSDSRLDRSFQYDLDTASGALSRRRRFVETSAYEGRIDGATVDADGHYWGALFEGAAIGCFDPDGRLLRKIAVPTRYPTMCSFGGSNLDILFVTSATFLMSEEEIAAESAPGALFAISGLGVCGIAEPTFKVGKAQ